MTRTLFSMIGLWMICVVLCNCDRYQRNLEVSDVTHLYEIGILMRAYARGHDGQYPENWDALRPYCSYCFDEDGRINRFFDPSTEAEGEMYLIAGRETIGERRVLAKSPGFRRLGVDCELVVFDDGEVERIEPKRK